MPKPKSPRPAGRPRYETPAAAGTLTLLPVAVVIFAAAIDVIVLDPKGGYSGRLGVVIALVGLTIVYFNQIRLAATLFPLAFAVSFISYEVLLFMRVPLRGVPINAVDAAALLALAGAILHRRRVRAAAEGALLRTGIVIALATVVVIPAFIHGVLVNGLYEALRDLRPFLFIGIGFFAARRFAGSPAIFRLLVQIVVLGAVFGCALMLFARVGSIGTIESYLDLRIGSTTAVVDVAFAIVTAFMICGVSLFRRKWPMWPLWGLTVAGAIISFNLTSYLLLAIVPFLTLWFAPIRFRRKVRIVFRAAAVAAIAVGAFVLVSAKAAAHLWEKVFQVLADLGSLTASVHVQARFITWNAAFELVKDNPLTGVGMGKREIIDTGIPLIGPVVAGEPTYSTYLIGGGVIAVLAVMVVQARLPFLAHRKMKSAMSPFMKATCLALLTYGLITVVNSFMHNVFMTAQLSVVHGFLLAMASWNDWPQEARPV